MFPISFLQHCNFNKVIGDTFGVSTNFLARKRSATDTDFRKAEKGTGGSLSLKCTLMLASAEYGCCGKFLGSSFGIAQEGSIFCSTSSW